jgi:hypothetical protein
MTKGEPEFRAEFVLFTQVEGRISAASGYPYYPLPATPFSRKAMTGRALLAFATSKVGHGTFDIDADASAPRNAAMHSRNSPSFRRPPA